MLDKAAGQIAAAQEEAEESLEQEASDTPSATPAKTWLDRLSPGSLTARIALINLLGLAILTGGILFFNQFRQGLIDARVQSLMTQAQIISAAIAGSATADTGNILINPDDLEDTTDESVSENDLVSGFDFPISPESVGPVLRRLLANTTIRARVIDPEGNLVVDSKFLYNGGDIFQSDLGQTQQELSWYVKSWNTLTGWLLTSDYPSYVEYGMDGNKSNPEVSAALNGASVSVVRLNDGREIIVLVSVPVQRFRAVLGALVLSTEGGEIDRVIRGERQIVLFTFAFSSFVTFLLSALLAGTIARPLRRLSAAAIRIRRGISKRVEIPDFTARKDEIGDLSGSVRDMTNALYGRMDAIEAFAADVSHELKNPLTSLRSAVETLQFVKRDDQRERLIEVVVDDVKRMDRLITDISNASRLDAELARNEAEPTDVARLLGTIASMVNETAMPSEPEIMLNVQPSDSTTGKVADYRILAHSSRLGQVFRNLIDNARSFTAPDTKVNVRLRAFATHIEVRIEDHGPGIAPENLERVFERFYTDRPESSFGKNSGLGLAISRQIVEAHKGRIWAENRQGRPDTSGERRIHGARFIVRLPRIPAGWEPQKLQ